MMPLGNNHINPGCKIVCKRAMVTVKLITPDAVIILDILKRDNQTLFCLPCNAVGCKQHHLSIKDFWGKKKIKPGPHRQQFYRKTQ